MKIFNRVIIFSCIMILISSCKIDSSKTSDNETTTSVTSETTPVSYTCDDLKAINKILFITSVYDKKYDLNNDSTVNVQDKLIIENNLLSNNAQCVTALRTCSDLPAVMAQVQSWPEMVSMPVVISSIANSIIYHESGQRCTDDFNTGSFISDVNKNGYIECSDPLLIQKNVVGMPLTGFEPALADVNSSGTFTALDALIVKIALNSMFNNYTGNLGECPLE